MSTENENESLGRQHFGDEDVTDEETQTQENEDPTPEPEQPEDGSEEQQETTDDDESSDSEEGEGEQADDGEGDDEKDAGEESQADPDTGDEDGEDDEPQTDEEEQAASPEPVAEPFRDQMVRDQTAGIQRGEDEHTSIYMLRVNLDEYGRRMARNKPQDVNSVISAQRLLHGILVSAFTQPSERLREAGNIVYQAFRDNTTGAFSPVYVNRGLREMAQQDRTKAFLLRGVCNIILRTRDPRDRDEVLEHIDIKPMLDEIDDADVRAGLMDYLRIG